MPQQIAVQMTVVLCAAVGEMQSNTSRADVITRPKSGLRSLRADGLNVVTASSPGSLRQNDLQPATTMVFEPGDSTVWANTACVFWTPRRHIVTVQEEFFGAMRRAKEMYTNVCDEGCTSALCKYNRVHHRSQRARATCHRFPGPSPRSDMDFSCSLDQQLQQQHP